MKIRFSALFIVLILLSRLSSASHIIGANVTYEHLGGGWTLFKVKMYRDCSGVPAQPSAYICITSPSGCDNDITAMLPMNVTTSGIQVSFNPCNGTGTTNCNGGVIHSFEEYNYEGVIMVPSCSDWVVSYDECCRNLAITNLVNLNFTSLHVETKFDNLNYPTNTSPQYNATPPNYYCLGIPAILDYSAYDADGDSLVYEFTYALEGSCGAAVPSPFLLPNTYDQPLAVFTPAILDPFGGQIQFTPSALQNSVVGFRVNEYRNGVLIGSVMRDDEIFVVGSYPNPDTLAGRVYYDLNTNNVFDAGDVPASNVVVELTPGTTFAVSAASGKFDFQVPAGTYTLGISNVPPYMNIVTTTYAVNTTGAGTFLGNHDFGLQPYTGIHDLEVSINNSSNPVPGQTYPVYVNYSNAGTTVEYNASITLTLDPTLDFVSSSPSPSIVAGNVITWNLPALALFSNGTINIETRVDTLAVAGDLVTCSVAITMPFNDQTPFNNSDSFTEEVVGLSFDPNRKEVTPSGDIPLSFVTSQQWLNYKISFQNTGNAPAQIIRVFDLLDFDLDFGSLELVASSYPCAMILQNNNELEFNFFGINLTTIVQNESGSRGFVEYRIKPKSTLPVNTLITNEASITFDFNPPVYTNLVHNKVVLSTDVATMHGAVSGITVFPNPSSDFINVEFNHNSEEAATIQIHNMVGEMVYKTNFTMIRGANQIVVPVSELNAGIYFMSLQSNDGSSVLKLMIED